MADNSCPCQVKRESMEIIFELLIQFLLEMFVQGAFELGFRGMLSIFGGFGERKDEERFNPWLAVCGYIFMGAVSGGLSVWLVPMHLLQPPAIQICVGDGRDSILLCGLTRWPGCPNLSGVAGGLDSGRLCLSCR